MYELAYTPNAFQNHIKDITQNSIKKKKLSMSATADCHVKFPFNMHTMQLLTLEVEGFRPIRNGYPVGV